MTRYFTPHFSILPAAQRALWPHLRATAGLGFVLYGGTAIALRLGHRTSVDFDFFSGRTLDRSALTANLPFVRHTEVLQEAPNTLTLLVSTDAGPVKVSFFAMPGLGRIGLPDFTDDDVLHVASCDDLLATKLKTILQRAEAKDYRDIAELLGNGSNLARGLAGARTLFGPNFQPAEAMKALTYFGDGDLDKLAKADRSLLIERVKAVDTIPVINRSADSPA